MDRSWRRAAACRSSARGRPGRAGARSSRAGGRRTADAERWLEPRRVRSGGLTATSANASHDKPSDQPSADSRLLTLAMLLAVPVAAFETPRAHRIRSAPLWVRRRRTARTARRAALDPALHARSWQDDARRVRALEELEHRAVLLVEQSRVDAHLVVGRDADEVLVERAVVDRAEAEPVGHRRLAGELRVGDDVGRVEEPGLLEPADRALVRVRREHAGAEAGLVEAHACLADGVAPFDRVVGKEGLALVVWPDHAAGCERDIRVRQDRPGDEDRPLGPVPAGPGADEVDERRLQLERRAERAVVGLVDVPGAVGVEEAVGRLRRRRRAT